MIIIGIMGGIGHGKTSLSEALQKAEPKSEYIETSVFISDVIDAWQTTLEKPPEPGNYTQINDSLVHLAAVLEQFLRRPVDAKTLQFSGKDVKTQPELYKKLFEYLTTVQSNPGLMKTKITPANKSAYRPMLQWLGGYVQNKLPPGVWFMELMRRVNEAGTSGTKLAIISGVRFPADADVIRSGGGYVINVSRPSVEMLDATDPTEQAKAAIRADTEAINDAALSDLLPCASAIYNDASVGKLKRSYKASSLSPKSATI